MTPDVSSAMADVLIIFGYLCAIVLGLTVGYMLFNANDKEYRNGYIKGFKVAQENISNETSKKPDRNIDSNPSTYTGKPTVSISSQLRDQIKKG